jgi:hypothetical protein
MSGRYRMAVQSAGKNYAPIDIEMLEREMRRR